MTIWKGIFLESFSLFEIDNQVFGLELKSPEMYASIIREYPRI